MATFYRREDMPCMVSFVSKVEAASESEAIELFANGEGELIGHSIGDQTGDVEHEEIATTQVSFVYDEDAGLKIDGLREALNKAWNFIENISDDDPDRTEKFFKLRELVRGVL